MIYFKKLVLFFCLILVLMLGTTYFLFSTEAGLKTIAKITNHFIPGHLQIDHVAGSLNKQIFIGKIYYENDFLIFSGKNLKITLQPLDLLTQGKLIINSIELESASLMHLPDSTQRNSHSYAWQIILSHLQNMNIKFINVRKLNIHYNNSKILINNFLVSQSQNHTYFNVDSNFGILTGTSAFEFHKNMTWFLTLTATHFNMDFINKKANSDISFKITVIAQLNNNKPQFKIWLQDLKGNIRHYPLQGAGYLAYHQGNFIFQQIKLNVGKSHLAINGNILNHFGAIHWDAMIPNLLEIIPNASGKFASKGTIKIRNKNFDVEAFINISNLILPTIKINHIAAEIKSSKLNAATINAQAIHIKIKNYHIKEMSLKNNLMYFKDKLTQQFQIILNHHQPIIGTINLPRFMQNGFADQIIQAQFRIPNIKAIALYQNPNLSILDGILNAKFQIAGTIKHPSWIGRGYFQNGRIRLNNLGITLENIELTGSLKNTQTLFLKGKFKSGNGQALIQGTINFYHKTIPDLHLNISGQNLQAINLNQYKLIISPHILLENNNNILNITGNIMIPYLRVLTDYNRAITLPSEVLFIDRANIKPTFPSQTRLGLKVTLGKDIFIAYKNLHAQLAGQIEVLQIPGSIPTGLGELYILNGEYRFYNQLLQINNGRLIYVGNSLYNPGINIEALKSIKNTNIFNSWLSSWFPQAAFDNSSHILVGASIKGTLNDPDIALISYPSMPHQDILSYLLTGSPLTSLSSGSSISAISLFASGLNLLTDEEDDSSDSSFSGFNHLAGGLFNSLQALNFSFPLTKNFNLITQTNWEETSIDLNYFNEYE